MITTIPESHDDSIDLYGYTATQELNDSDRADLDSLDETGLPTWTPRQSDESLHQYGYRMVQFLMAFAYTAPLTDDDLALAAHMATYVVTAPNVSPLVLARVDTMLLLVRAIQKGRAQLAASAVVPAGTVSLSPAPSDDGSAAVPAKPLPIVRPPSGQKVEINF